MRWQQYALKKQIKTQNSIGQWIQSWEDVCEIDVIVSNKLYSVVIDEMVYRKFEPTAITKFKDLDNGYTYKIINADNAYQISSFNTGGRYAQLLLKEVIQNG